MERSRNDWLAEGPLRRVRIRFAAQDELGVLDHDVQLPSGDTVHNPLRVVPNGAGPSDRSTATHLPERDLYLKKSTKAFSFGASWARLA